MAAAVEPAAQGTGAVLQSADPAPRPCKICRAPSPLFGVVDFHKSCEEGRGRKLTLSGIPVYYRRCGQCGFVFTQAFDTWTRAEFLRHIYNPDYRFVDPDYLETRPNHNAAMVAETFGGSRDSIRILDYGGGNGLLAERLRSLCFDAETYDPMHEFEVLPEGQFDLVTCFEVMEHVPEPGKTVAEIASLLATDGVVLFSTLVQPEGFERTGLEWWYAAPRNGHISLYTPPALARLFGAHGMRVGSFSDALHIAYSRVPEFAAHLQLPEN